MNPITTKKALGAGAAATAVLGLTAPAVGAQTDVEAAAASATTWRAHCALSKAGWLGVVYGEVRSSFDVTIHGYRSGNTGTVTSIDYDFGYADFYLAGSGTYLGRIERGNSSNVNVTSPISRNSGDNMPPTGTWDVPNFNFTKGATLGVQGILDVKDFPDPSCTASVRADWSDK